MTIRTLTYIHGLLKVNKDGWCKDYERMVKDENLSEETKDIYFNMKMEAINALDEFEEHDWS